MAWGQGVLLDAFAPSMRAVPGLRESWSRYERFSASPGVARAMVENLLELDVRHVLPAIHVPTLVISHADAHRLRAAHSADTSRSTSRAPGSSSCPGSTTSCGRATRRPSSRRSQSFVTGAHPVHASDRRLATVLFTDIVGSTKRAAEVGDRAWRELLDRHDELVRSCIERAGGRLVKTTGDGVLATFDGPGRALEASREISTSAPTLDLHVRAGLHAGEIEIDRRRHRRAGRPRRGSRLRARRPGRGAREQHRSRPRLRFGGGVQRPRQPRPEGRARSVASVRGGVRPLVTSFRSWRYGPQ